MSLFLRRLTKAAVRCEPRPLTRHLLKSCWYQPRVQDALRFHVEPYRFDSAIPTSLEVDRARLMQPRSLPGVRLDEVRHLAFVAELEPFARVISS